MSANVTGRRQASRGGDRRPSYGFLRACSFLHSAIYLTLLTLVAIPDHQGAQVVFGYGHGIGWILMTLMALRAAQLRTITIPHAALISIGGAIGPFVGSAAFVVLDRRRRRSVDQGSRALV